MEKNRNTILCFYFILSLVVILCSTTDFTLQNIGFALVMVELVAAYFARSKFPKNESFEENHTTFLIRTIWIYTSIAAIGMVGLAIVLISQGNMDSFNTMANQMVTGGIEPTEEQMRTYMEQYISDNLSLIQRQYIMWLFPAQLYLVWRIFQGGGRAFKNYRIANPKKWL